MEIAEPKQSPMAEITNTPSADSLDVDDAVVDVDAYEYGKEDPVEKPRARGKVSFGDVKVRTHRMTLGTNPSTKVGLPVELSWDKQSSELFTLDKFEEKPKSKAKKIDQQKRQEIAKLHHSRDSIVKRQVELYQTKQSIEKSRQEAEADPLGEKDEEKQQQLQKQANSACCVIS